MNQAPAVTLGPIHVWTPVILAPMAGVTDAPFRRLCREFGEASLPKEALEKTTAHIDAPSGLYVTEMITSRALVEGTPETLRMIEPDPHERVRSVQLYGVDPATMAAATRILVERGYADHVDLNFGCPVPKVTRKGGGAAIPWKKDLFEAIVRAVVTEADVAAPGGPGSVPVTIKMRIGIDDDHYTALEAARLAERSGVAGIGLHARTQEQYYSGNARWEWISRVKEQSTVPVFGNGDVFSGTDAVRMLEETGCDAVTIGRGCQGRPWLFREITAAVHGKAQPTPPRLTEVVEIILRHTELMISVMGEEDRALREMRKHIGWYLRGFAVGGSARHQLGLVKTHAELSERLSNLDQDQEYPGVASGARGRAGGPKKPHLPQGWLIDQVLSDEQKKVLHLAEDGVSGG